ncbi:hypothetical protein HMPREF1987_00172 [Peptostreptococcaceae bacterium oral taxon 113 str. W5053]|nr:hypothetical protein HMPREF1987_00172 [Peptostreptococcaceae bacterium oral taxon 113 str. W5053]
MKLIIAILQDTILQEAVRRLSTQKYPVTKLSSTGGFLKSGNTTLLIGVQDEVVSNVLEILKEVSMEKEGYERDAKVAMANIFVLDMEQYRKM